MCVTSYKEYSHAFRDSKSCTLFAVDILLAEDTRSNRKVLRQNYDDGENMTDLMFFNAGYSLHSSQ